MPFPVITVKQTHKHSQRDTQKHRHINMGGYNKLQLHRAVIK